MKSISGDLAGELKRMLPETYGILSTSNLTVHDAVCAVMLSGSRGPGGGYRPDSDVDLSLLVDAGVLRETGDPGGMLEDVIDISLRAWKSPVELDTAAVFDKLSCGLICFQLARFVDLGCHKMRPDCFGLYKTQKGFHGFVPDIGLAIEKVYPMMRIWAAAPS